MLCLHTCLCPWQILVSCSFPCPATMFVPQLLVYCVQYSYLCTAMSHAARQLLQALPTWMCAVLLSSWCDDTKCLRCIAPHMICCSADDRTAITAMTSPSMLICTSVTVLQAAAAAPTATTGWLLASATHRMAPAEHPTCGFLLMYKQHSCNMWLMG